MFFENLLDYIVALFNQTFNNIPHEGTLSIVYLVGNFILLLWAGISSGNFNILGKNG